MSSLPRMIGTPPAKVIPFGTSFTLPDFSCSPYTAVVSFVATTVAAFRDAMSYERGLAPVSRRNTTGTPAASVTTMVTFHLFLRASASAASIT
jgi:hypothetical protein